MNRLVDWLKAAEAGTDEILDWKAETIDGFGCVYAYIVDQDIWVIIDPGGSWAWVSTEYRTPNCVWFSSPTILTADLRNGTAARDAKVAHESA